MAFDVVQLCRQTSLCNDQLCWVEMRPFHLFSQSTWETETMRRAAQTWSCKGGCPLILAVAPHCTCICRDFQSLCTLTTTSCPSPVNGIRDVNLKACDPLPTACWMGSRGGGAKLGLLTPCQDAALEGAPSDFPLLAQRTICSSVLLMARAVKESISIQTAFPFSIAAGGPNPFSVLGEEPAWGLS